MNALELLKQGPSKGEKLLTSATETEDKGEQKRLFVKQPNAVALVLSFMGAGLALLTGWLGGELVDRLDIGVDSKRTRTLRVRCQVGQSVNLNRYP